ncbi:MAG: AAA family ATPase [Phycisphaerales bacterium]|nr:AAA family ATPase [Phycisphaerales bacterium]
MASKKAASDPIAQWTELDLTAAAERGELPPAFELDDGVSMIAEVLAAGRCPLLSGESGVGKTAAVHEFVRRSIRTDAAYPLNGRRVVQLSIQRRASSLRNPYEQLRPDLQAVLEALAGTDGRVIPFLRDAHLAHAFGAASQLSALARLGAPGIAEGVRDDLRAMFEDDPGLEERFVTIPIEQPSLERVARILSMWAAGQAAGQGPRFDPGAIDAAIQLCHRFLVRGRLPRTALELLGQIGALSTGRRAIRQSDVIERFCTMHRTPRVLVDPAEPLDMAALEARFAAQALGQPEAVRAVVHTICVIKAGMTDPRRPLAAFLFVGPTGVGKTHIAQMLAEFLFGSRDRLIRLNMSDYADPSATETLLGDPNGYTPSQKRGLLATRIRGHGLGVLLLDEFEKAHRKVHDAVLQLVDEGAFVNAEGHSFSCRSMVIIATSNAGAEIFRGEGFGFASAVQDRERRAELERRLEGHFRLELLNRFDQVVHFLPLSREDIRQIARRELELLEHRSGLRSAGYALDVDESVLDWLAVHGYEPDFGARFLRRTMERHVTTPLADVIARRRPPHGARLLLTARADGIVARVVEPSAPAGAPAAGAASAASPTGRVVTRPADRVELRRRLLALAEPRLSALHEKSVRHDALLTRMNEPGFWDRADQRRELLDEFRRLDVAIQVERRLARAIEHLADLSEAECADPHLAAEADELLARAGDSLSDWERRVADEGPAALWVFVAGTDALRVPSRWIADLAQMELAWARRCGLFAAVVAYGPSDEQIGRVVIQVEGPGAAQAMEMEAGLHRLVRRQDADQRAAIRLLPISESGSAHAADVGELRPRAGRFDLSIKYRGRLSLPERGLTLDLLAPRRETLAHLLADLAAAPTEVGASGETARLYDERDGVVRDPRTKAADPRLKEVLRGRLERFAERWAARSEAEPAGT